MAVGAAAVPALAKDFLGHPRGLVVLFFAEMWERFSFYGMRALLIFYLTEHFLFDDAISAGIYATYGSLVYLMPVVGGMIADRYLGFRKGRDLGSGAVVHRPISAWPSRASRPVPRMAPWCATGWRYRSSICPWPSSSWGWASSSPAFPTWWAPCTARTTAAGDGGFTLFYMGINLGAVVAGPAVRLPRPNLRLALRLRAGGGRHVGGAGHLPGRSPPPAWGGGTAGRGRPAAGFGGGGSTANGPSICWRWLAWRWRGSYHAAPRLGWRLAAWCRGRRGGRRHLVLLGPLHAGGAGPHACPADAHRLFGGVLGFV